MFDVLAKAASAVEMTRNDSLAALRRMSPAKPDQRRAAPFAALLDTASAPVIGWPERGEGWKLALMTGSFCTLFWSAYWSANQYAAAAPRFRVDLPFETHIPFLPWACVLYVSIVPLMLMAPFVCRSAARMWPLFCALCAEVAAASLVFLAFPVELGYPPLPATGAAAGLMDAARQAALQYNLFPSLHVTFALTTAAALAPIGGPRWKTVIWIWSFLIVASTLLTHQHHVADVLAGAVLSIAVMRGVYPSITGA